MPHTGENVLNDALRLVRVYHDLSLGETSTKVGLSKSYVSEIENGRKKVTMEVLEKYAMAFELPMSSLMLFAEQKADGQPVSASRAYVADRAIKMLDWIASITAEKAR